MRRILIFSLAYYPHIGGAEIAIKEITDRISDAEFHVITLRFRGESRRERIENVEVHRVGWGGGYLSKIFFAPLAALKARALHRKTRFDGSWAMMSYMLFPVVFARAIGVRIPYALTLQEGDTYNHMYKRIRIRLFLPLISWGFKHAAIVQAISNYLAQWARDFGYKGPIEIIPNGCDPWWLTEEASSEHTARIWEEHGIPDGIKLITTSRLVRKNALDTVIRALPHIPGTQFVILGEGPEHRKLRKLARKMGVKKRVHFLGEIPNSTIIHFLHASDIFIRPSRSEGMGNSFIEAMAAGLPVIATQVGGIADFLFDEKRNPGKPVTGWAVDVDAPEQIAGAVEDILAHPEKMNRAVTNAKRMVSEKYNWDVIARDMQEKVFARLV